MSQQPPLARYSFVPWLRQGLASSITQADTLGNAPSGLQERVSIQVTLNINDTDPVNKEVKIIGPGDITGIEQRAVVRTEPKPRTPSFEPNYLAAVEFYDEDFLWRYTPAAATPQEQLRPWLCLVVLTKDDDEFERFSAPGMPLPGLRLKVGDVTDVFPKPDQVWSWAHVHVNRDIKAQDNSQEQAVANLASILATNTDLAISRLVSPRRLKPNRGYDAFVIPSFEAGRLVGLGETVPSTIDPLQSAWDGGQKEFPIYYEWSFRTGDRGDFEFLVRLLKPRVLDPRVGIRPMDVQRPEYGLPAIIDPPALGLEGALKTPDTRSTVWKDKEPFQSDLAALVNQSDTSLEPGATSDPVVTPPLYGRWHAAVRRLREANNPPWIDTLNLDPRHRVAAGFGTLVIQTHQEEYMNAAWQQVGAIEEANRLLRLARFARLASLKMYGKHLESAPPAQLLSLTAQVHRRVVDVAPDGPGLTLRQQMAESTLPLAAVRPSFRRLARPRGPVARRISDLRVRAPGNMAARINQGEITAAPPKAVPGQVVTMDRVADKLKPPEMQGCLARIWPVLRPVFPILIAILTFLSRFIAALKPTVENLRRLFEAQTAAETMRGASLTPDAARRVPARPGFQLTRPGDVVPAPGAGGRDSVQAANFRTALLDLTEGLTLALPPLPTPRPLSFDAARHTVLQELDPKRTVAARFGSRVFLADDLRIDPEDLIAPIMAAPDLPYPMYAPLRDESPELLCPNLNLIPPNTISLLITNEPFIEAYMAGLNHEMSRELLWREFPTDQRGTYFRQFWDVADVPDPAPNLTPAQRAERLKDIKPIHHWLRPANLGDNNNRPLPGNAERLVLVVRGELLIRYPTAVIFAVKARWLNQPDSEGRTRLPHEDEYSSDPARVKQVVKLHSFKAKVDPDLRFIGFDLTVDEARGAKTKEEGDAGWFFVIQERPGEPRFGFDEPDGGFGNVQLIHHWNDLTWGHLAATQTEYDKYSVIDLSKPLHQVGVIQAQPGMDPADTVTRDNEVTWASNAADMAYILLQIPVKIYVHASEMLSEKRTP